MTYVTFLDIASVVLDRAVSTRPECYGNLFELVEEVQGERKLRDIVAGFRKEVCHVLRRFQRNWTRGGQETR